MNSLTQALRFLLTSSNSSGERLPWDCLRLIEAYLSPDETLSVLRFVCRTLHSLTSGFKLRLVVQRFSLSKSLLEWLHARGYQFNSNTGYHVIKQVNLESLKWLHSRDYYLSTSMFQDAAEIGNIEIMKWLRSQNCPWDTWAFGYALEHARRSGNFENLHWLKDNNCPFSRWAIEMCGWIRNMNPKIKQWLQDNGYIN